MGWSDAPIVGSDEKSSDTGTRWSSAPPAEPTGPGFMATAEDVAKSVASGLTEWGPMHVTMAPIVLGVVFLASRAAVIRRHPKEQREARRRELGVWPRLMIVLSFMWSGLLTLAIAFLNGKVGEIGSSLPLAYLTFIPVLALWMIYFAARWVRQGAKTV